MRNLFFFFALLLLSNITYAAQIKGTVKDANTGFPLIGVIVNLTNTSIGNATDIDGKFLLDKVSAGTYEIKFSYSGFETVTEQIKVSANEMILDITMKPEKTELKELTVKGTKVTSTENAVMMEVKNSLSLASGIGAKQIAKTLDRSAADVVKRVPGVTIQDEKFIVVRGLPDRYNTVWLNDATAPSAEIDKKSFSFDIIPSGSIDRILIFKTPSADLPGDFAGGMIKIFTNSITDNNTISVGFQTSWRDNTTGNNFIYSKTSSTDWLGYDDGGRGIPKGAPDYISKNDPNNSALSKSFGNDWGVNNKVAPNDYRLSLSLSNMVKFKKFKVGNTFALSYSNLYTNYNIHRMEWDSSTATDNYMIHKSENKVSATLMDNVAVVFGNSKIEFKNFYNQLGKSTAYIFNTIVDTSLVQSNSIDKNYVYDYQSTATYMSQLMGSHKSKSENTLYTWLLGYTDLFKNEPNLRQIRYSKQPGQDDSMYRAAIPSGAIDIVNGGGRYYSTLYEKCFSLNHQFTQKVNFSDNYKISFVAGNFIE